jgi:hypothetical protein
MADTVEKETAFLRLAILAVAGAGGYFIYKAFATKKVAQETPDLVTPEPTIVAKTSSVQVTPDMVAQIIKSVAASNPTATPEQIARAANSVMQSVQPATAQTTVAGGGAILSIESSGISGIDTFMERVRTVPGLSDKIANAISSHITGDEMVSLLQSEPAFWSQYEGDHPKVVAMANEIVKL